MRYREDRNEMKARDESKLRNGCSGYSAIDYKQKVTAHNIFKREVTITKSYCTIIHLNVKFTSIIWHLSNR